jgi:hypothetical protein
MKHPAIQLLTIFLIIIQFEVFAQPAPWVSYPSANQTAYGVYHFRKSFDLEKVPEKLVVHVSADNRYNLFVNGQRVCYGPAKGDLQTYKYDVIDIAPFLKTGKNMLAALVYNGGEDRPLAFISVQTAFMLRSENENFSFLNSGSGWKTYKNPAYEVISYNEMLSRERWFYGFYACGGGDEVFAEKYPWGWENVDFDDSNWLPAEPLDFGKQPWTLVPRNIAFMDNHLVYPEKIRNVTGVNIPVGNWNGKTKLMIPANTKASVLVDFDIFTMGYPELTVSGGKGSKIQVKYAEALYEAVNLKAHRDSVNNLNMFGVWDIFHADGEKRTFRPLWKRTFRYVQFNIETKNEPLEISSYVLEYSGYPYPEMARFESDDARLNEIFEMSKRTLRMCSGETYYDTPFYEQLNYGGDNRPIAAISTYNSTDDRLLREAIRLYPQSENPETGLLHSAYPSSRTWWDMGSWSMAWVQSLHDYYFMRGDSVFVKQFSKKIDKILRYFERHLDEKTGLIGTVNCKNFIDWSITKGSLPRTDENGEMKQSALLTLYFAHTLDCTEKLYNELGLKDKAANWQKLSEQIKPAVYRNCWDVEKQLFRDYPNKPIYSQHTNLFAILCDLVPLPEQQKLMDRILTYDKFDEMASSYFSFFLFKALQKTGKENLFLENLDFWYTFIDRGHTTCGETGFASHDRSDCHAWSAHPAYFMLSSVCGINPADVSFNTVKITPHLGNLKTLKADMPHPKGRISVEYKKEKDKWKTVIVLPAGMKGTFTSGSFNYSLVEGKNIFDYKVDL